jgi:hypothetical protein
MPSRVARTRASGFARLRAGELAFGVRRTLNTLKAVSQRHLSQQ